MRSRRLPGTLIAVAGSAAFSFAIHAAAVPPPDRAVQETPPSGAEVYRNQCQPCHGSEGKGDGPASRFVDPKPRDLTSQYWMYAPDKTLEQVIGVVSKGVEDTGMEPFDELLTADEIAAVAAYVLKTFTGQAESR